MASHRILAAALAIVSLASPSLHARPKHRVLSVPPGKIVVDGKIGAGEWQLEGKRSMPCAIPAAGDASKFRTETWVAFDGATLSLLIRVNVDADKPLVTAGNWGGRDGLEIAFRDSRNEKQPIVSAYGYPDGTLTGYAVDGPRAAPKDVIDKAAAYAATIEKDHWTAELSVPLAEVGIPVEGLETLSFNLNIRRMCDRTWMVWSRTRGPVWEVDTAGRLLFGDVEIEDDANELMPQQLPSAWQFRADPDERGVKEGWATSELCDVWCEARIDLRRGWRMTGIDKDFAGWGWLRQTVTLPPDVQDAKCLWLFLPAVDEQCEIYINGKKTAEHTEKSAGLPPGHLWNDPILVDVTDTWGKRDAAVEVAVRFLAYTPSCGLRKPAFLVGGAGEMPKAADLYARLVDDGVLWPLSRDLRVAEIPELPPHPAPQTLGSRIQRTMTLLATSTPSCRHHVKILFYGQSITAGMHWVQIANTLRQRFPYAIIEVENRAIGGFTAPSLCRTAVSDLYTTDADLVVFHDYGGEQTGELERMIATLRRVSTADVLIYMHTVAWVDNPKGLEGRTRGDSNSAAFNRYLAQKYNLELVESREEWQQFLDVHGIGINEYMGNKVKSNVHPNGAGHTLLAQLCLRHFQYNPYHPGGWGDKIRWVEARAALEEAHSPITLDGPWQRDRYGITAKEGKCSITLPFDGSRVDIVPAPGTTVGTFTMAIDGKAPETFPELFACTKPTGITPGASWPVFKRITLPNDTPPILQDWTATVTECDTKAKMFRYNVVGSVTGPDGAGSNKSDFGSNSGQVRIAASDCFLIWPLSYRKMECPRDLAVTWSVYPLYTQPVALGPALDRSIDRRIPLFRGLRSGKHTLTLTWNGDAPAGIKAFVVHRPDGSY